MTDWLQATAAERKALYDTFKRICREKRTTFDRQMDIVFEGKVVFGTDYERACRKGAMARDRALTLANWIAAHHPAYARALDRALDDMRSGKDHGRRIVARVGNAKIIALNEDGSVSENDLDGLRRALGIAQNSPAASPGRGRAFNRVFGET